MAIFRPKPSQIFFFGLVPKSPIHIGLIYVRNPKPNISCLGPFKFLFEADPIEVLFGTFSFFLLAFLFSVEALPEADPHEFLFGTFYVFFSLSFLLSV